MDSEGSGCDVKFAWRENHQNLQSGYAVSWLKFELSTSKMSQEHYQHDHLLSVSIVLRSQLTHERCKLITQDSAFYRNTQHYSRQEPILGLPKPDESSPS
jgi:hypothetical protein